MTMWTWDSINFTLIWGTITSVNGAITVLIAERSGETRKKIRKSITDFHNNIDLFLMNRKIHLFGQNFYNGPVQTCQTSYSCTEIKDFDKIIVGINTAWKNLSFHLLPCLFLHPVLKREISGRTKLPFFDEVLSKVKNTSYLAKEIDTGIYETPNIGKGYWGLGHLLFELLRVWGSYAPLHESTFNDYKEWATQNQKYAGPQGFDYNLMKQQLIPAGTSGSMQWMPPPDKSFVYIILQEVDEIMTFIGKQLNMLHNKKKSYRWRRYFWDLWLEIAGSISKGRQQAFLEFSHLKREKKKQ